MPTLLIPTLGYLLGAALAWGGRRPTGAGIDETRSSALTVVAAYAVLVYAPACSFVVALAPDWSISYVVSLDGVGLPLQAGIALAAATSVPLGFSTTARVRPGSSAWLGRTTPWALLALTAVVAGLPRLQVVGSQAQYEGGFGLRRLTQSVVSYALILAAGVIAAGAAWSYRALGQLARRDEMD